MSRNKNLYIYKWAKQKDDLYFKFPWILDRIREELKKFGVKANIEENRFWFTIRFVSREDLNLFKLLTASKISDVRIKNRQLWSY